MTRLPRIVTLLASGFLLAACGQLIGLGDFESVDEADAGEAGETSAGRGGRAGAGGLGGSAGSATAGTAGDSAGAGGSTGGSSTTGGMAGEVGSGGTGGSTGGTGSNQGGESGEAGSGGEAGDPVTPGCTEVRPTGFMSADIDDADPSSTSAFYRFSLSNIGSSLADEIWFEFYDGEGNYNGVETGTFALGSDIDQNFETCARCVRGRQDLSSTSLLKKYFQASGTVTVSSPATHMSGFPTSVIYRDLTLVESEIDDGDGGTYVSRPIPGGACIRITEFELKIDPPPAEWVCLGKEYIDPLCSCGCGVVDPSCLSPYGNACEECPTNSCGYSTDGCSGIDVTNNALCDPSWTCDIEYYDDAGCDCGCGIPDIDCEGNSGVSACAYCWCGASGGSCTAPNGVDPANNALCVPQ